MGVRSHFYAHLRDRPIFGVAGIWERKKGEDGTEGLSCALITTPANELLAEVHNEKLRMPAVLREEDHAAWLTGRPEEAMHALQPYPSDGMEAWQISRRLYANKTPNDEGLIERVRRRVEGAASFLGFRLYWHFAKIWPRIVVPAR